MKAKILKMKIRVVMMKSKLLKAVIRVVLAKLAKDPHLLMWVGRELVENMASADAVSLTLSIRDKIRGRLEA